MQKLHSLVHANNLSYVKGAVDGLLGLLKHFLLLLETFGQ